MKIHQRRNVSYSLELNSATENTSPDELIASLKESMKGLITCQFFIRLQQIIGLTISTTSKPFSIVVLGLGRFSKSKSSLLQLALVLCLEEFCNMNSSHEVPEGRMIVRLYDPVFTPLEIHVCKMLGFSVMNDNLSGKVDIPAEESVLFFMPHCPYRLYCNVIWYHWEHLERIHILGNR